MANIYEQSVSWSAQIIAKSIVLSIWSATVAWLVWISMDFLSFPRAQQHTKQGSISKQNVGQLFLVFAQLEQSKQGWNCWKQREEKIRPTERAQEFVANKTPDGYKQTIGGSRRGCTRACRTTIRLFGGRKARWTGFTLARNKPLLSNGTLAWVVDCSLQGQFHKQIRLYLLLQTRSVFRDTRIQFSSLWVSYL